MSISSLCGLGMAAPTPILTAIKYFPADFKEKVINKKSAEGSPW